MGNARQETNAKIFGGLLIVLTNFSPDDMSGTSARAISIFKEIQKISPNVYIMMKQGEIKNIDANYVLINPFLKLTGNRTLLARIFFRFQIIVNALSFSRNKKIRFVVLRGFDLVFLIPLLKLFRIRVVLDFHGLDYIIHLQQKHFFMGIVVFLCDHIMLIMSDIILVVSEGVKNQIRQYSHKCLILPNGVDLNEILSTSTTSDINIPPNITIVGFIGNWESSMKIDDICKAVNFTPNTVALIVGKGYDAETIMERYRDSDKIIFSGIKPKNEMYALLKLMDICILPYDEKAIQHRIKNFYSSRKATEYLAAGKPIIVSDVNGREEWLDPPKNCLLYKSGDPKDLAEKIMILKNEKILLDIMGSNNSKLAEKFTWKNILQSSGLIEYLTKTSE